jgi:hypothetical protein
MRWRGNSDTSLVAVLLRVSGAVSAAAAMTALIVR